MLSLYNLTQLERHEFKFWIITSNVKCWSSAEGSIKKIEPSVASLFFLIHFLWDDLNIYYLKTKFKI